MLRIYKAEFTKKIKNIEARTKELYSYLQKCVLYVICVYICGMKCCGYINMSQSMNENNLISYG